MSAASIIVAVESHGDPGSTDGGCSPLSCHGYCGGQAPGGCWCDELCCGFFDCCPDKYAACGGCGGEGTHICYRSCGTSPPFSGCWCDEACCAFLDCCSDKFHWCGGCNPIVPNSCAMSCGSKAAGGCWCDECCCDLGDCCADKFQICGGCNSTGRTGGPADINDDLAVSVLDLLAVINAWGPCTLPPAVPCAQADIAPHPQGDRKVDVLDLLMVINNWG